MATNAIALPWPVRFRRQYAAPLLVDEEFQTTAEREAYLSSPLRYAGQRCYDYEADAYFRISKDKASWLPFGEGGTSGGVQTVTGDSVNNNDPLNPVVNAIPFDGNTATMPEFTNLVWGTITDYFLRIYGDSIEGAFIESAHNMNLFALNNVSFRAHGKVRFSEGLDNDIKTFIFPNKPLGTYTLATLEDIQNSGGGATTFSALTDTPSGFTGHSLKSVRVKSDETGLEYYTPASGGTPTYYQGFYGGVSYQYGEAGAQVDFIADVDNDPQFTFYHGTSGYRVIMPLSGSSTKTVAFVEDLPAVESNAFELLGSTTITVPAQKTRMHLYRSTSTAQTFSLSGMKNGDLIVLHYKNTGASSVDIQFTGVMMDTRDAGLSSTVSVAANEVWEFTLVNSPLATSGTARKIA